MVPPTFRALSPQGCARSLVADNGACRDVLLAPPENGGPFVVELAGGFHRMESEDGFQLVAIPRWRPMPGTRLAHRYEL